MSKKKKKVVVNPSPVKIGPVFNYTGVCCSARASKPPVERSKADRAENKYSECSLGSWRCTKCEEPCKVTRSRVKDKETDAGVARTEIKPQ